MENGKFLSNVLWFTLLAKFFIGIFEFLAGLLFLLSGSQILDNFITLLAKEEVADDPNNLVINYFTKMAGGISVMPQIYPALYLILHGVVNIFLAVFVSRNKIWAYPWAILAFLIFIAYQLQRFYFTHSLLLLVLTAFDILISMLIAFEYKSKLKRHESI